MRVHRKRNLFFGAVLAVAGLLLAGWTVHLIVTTYKFDRDDRFRVSGIAELVGPYVLGPDEVLRYQRTETCNEGVDLLLVRWVELDSTGVALSLGDIEWPYAPRPDADDNGCVNPSLIDVPIPGDVPDGVWRLRVDNCWESYGNRQKCVRTYSPAFEVRR